jgi:hypothetical protein
MGAATVAATYVRRGKRFRVLIRPGGGRRISRAARPKRMRSPGPALQSARAGRRGSHELAGADEADDNRTETDAGHPRSPSALSRRDGRHRRDPQEYREGLQESPGHLGVSGDRGPPVDRRHARADRRGAGQAARRRPLHGLHRADPLSADPVLSVADERPRVPGSNPAADLKFFFGRQPSKRDRQRHPAPPTVAGKHRPSSNWKVKGDQLGATATSPRLKARPGMAVATRRNLLRFRYPLRGIAGTGAAATLASARPRRPGDPAVYPKFGPPSIVRCCRRWSTSCCRNGLTLRPSRGGHSGSGRRATSLRPLTSNDCTRGGHGCPRTGGGSSPSRASFRWQPRPS